MTAVCVEKGTSAFKKKLQEVDNQCVCEICSCRKHHCPPRHVEFKGDTTNHHFYKPHNVAVERVHKCAYSLNQNHYDPDLLKSTYRTNYKAYQCEPAHYQSKYAYQPNTSKFYDETQYKKNYTPNQIQLQKPVPSNHQYRPSSGKFDGNTTYKTCYKGKQTEQTQIKKHYVYQTNNLPFYGHTTYGDQFKKYHIEGERPQTCHHGRYAGSATRFEGKSSYQDQYKGLQNPKACHCMILDMPPRPRECSPGKDHLHFSAQECNWK